MYHARDYFKAGQLLMSSALQQTAVAFESLEEAVIIISPEDEILHVNSGCQRLFGYSKAELIGQPVSLLIPPGGVLVDDKLVRASPGNRWQGEVIRKKKGGEKFFAHLTVTYLRDQAQKVIGRVEVERDISERKRLQAQLFQAQKMEAVGRLAGGMAHDFNNLLTPIMSYAQLAAKTVPPESRANLYLLEINKAAERASHLTRQLLAFSRRQMSEEKVINLNDLILDMDKMFRRLIGEDIELITLTAPDLGLIKADPGQIEQVLVNLVVNARDAIPAVGKIIIETSNVMSPEALGGLRLDIASAGYVLLAVTDTGVGMTPEVKDRLFEPFFTTKEVGKGTGLGLSTCYGVITRSGGYIEVDSEPGLGSTFRVYLPRVTQPMDLSFLTSNPGKIPQGNETVLVVEDEQLVRDVTSQILREQGYTVLEAANGHEAMGLAQERSGTQIHLLLTDVVMPLMGGKELAQHFVQIHPEARVLYFSGYTDEVILRPGGVQGPTSGFMQKPFTSSVLASKVREILEG